MHVPSRYDMSDRRTLLEFIRRYSFGLLVGGSGETEAPMATHLPMLVEEREEHMVLTGHMARANPQWKEVDGRQVLAVFSGPHAYISPAWYGETNVVPTWNYMSVHVFGRFEVISDTDAALVHLGQAVDYFEASASEPWRLESTDPEFQRSLAVAIVAFSIRVDQIQGAWKLNQHHPESRRASTIAGLRRRSLGDDLEIADQMEKQVEPG